MPSTTLWDNDGDEQRTLIKRKKTNDPERPLRLTGESGSRLFAPFRTIGLVSSTPVPFAAVPLGKTTFQITTSVGRCLQTYDLRRGLNLVFLSRPETPENITATAAWKDRVFAAWGRTGVEGRQGIWVFKRGRKIDEVEMPRGKQGLVHQLLVVGSWIVGLCDNQIHIWKSVTLELYTTLAPAGRRTGKRKRILSGVICTMPTFLNKIFVGRVDGGIEIWNVSSGRLVHTILPPSADVGPVSALQPSPALGILAVAYESGPLLLHDVGADKVALRLTSGPQKSGCVSCISFRTDGLGAGPDGRLPGVMATCGPGTGDVQFWDLNKGGRIIGILRGAHDPRSTAPGAAEGGLNKVEFLENQPVIVSSGLDNSLKTWIFDETPFSATPRILHSRRGHAAPVTRMAFLPSGADDADSEGKWLLSASRDRSLWGWSLRRDGQSTELSQGNTKKKGKKTGLWVNRLNTTMAEANFQDLKASEIVCIAMSLNRDGGTGAAPNAGAPWSNERTNERRKGAAASAVNGFTGWESVVTGHKDDRYARTWFWGRKRAGRWAFETGDKGNVTSVAVSACGTFALIGSSQGGIDMFNLQSGQHRRSFPAKLSRSQAEHRKAHPAPAGAGLHGSSAVELAVQLSPRKHIGAVTGLMVDNINKTLISTGVDGQIKFWDFTTGKFLDNMDVLLYTAITGLRYHAANDLVAVTTLDCSVKVVDVETKKVVRELRGGAEAIHDFCFSNDGRWIVASSADSFIRVWDLPTGHQIDAIRLSSPCTALAFSGTGEYLATAHEDSIGIHLWSNQTLFKHVSTRPVRDEGSAVVQHPTVSGEGGLGLLEAVNDAEEELDEESLRNAVSTGPSQLSEQLLSLSLVPSSRWQTLIQLDLIKQRNKPKEPPKAAEKAPFFLSALTHASKGEEANPQSSIIISDRTRIAKAAAPGGGTSAGNLFTALLQRAAEDGDYGLFIAHLKSLPPAAADLEIRSLSPPSSASSHEFTHFITALTSRLAHKLDYELVQAWMTVFLRVHGSDIMTMAAHGEGEELGGGRHPALLRHALLEWKACQEKEAARLRGLVGYCAGVVAFLRGPV